MKIANYVPDFFIKCPKLEQRSFAEQGRLTDDLYVGMLDNKVVKVATYPLKLLIQSFGFITSNTSIFIYNNTYARKREISTLIMDDLRLF